MSTVQKTVVTARIPGVTRNTLAGDVAESDIFDILDQESAEASQAPPLAHPRKALGDFAAADNQAPVTLNKYAPLACGTASL